jgi:hypothetical protein
MNSVCCGNLLAGITEESIYVLVVGSWAKAPDTNRHSNPINNFEYFLLAITKIYVIELRIRFATIGAKISIDT